MQYIAPTDNNKQLEKIMKKMITLLLTLSIFTTTTFANVPAQEMTETAIAQTSVELQKVKEMSDVEFEIYLMEQADLLDRHGYGEQADQLRLFADAEIKADFERVIENNLNDSASNGLLLGVAIVGCSSIILCPILIFLAIATFSDLEPATDI